MRGKIVQPDQHPKPRLLCQRNCAGAVTIHTEAHDTRGPEAAVESPRRSQAHECRLDPLLAAMNDAPATITRPSASSSSARQLKSSKPAGSAK